MSNKFIDKFNNEKTKTQLYKLCEAIIICLLLLIIVEALFQIPFINQFFDPSSGGIGNSMSVSSWIVLWALMFLQVTIIPIPMLPILVFCNKTGLISGANTSVWSLFSLESLFFVLFCTSAITAGSATAYVIGKLFGRKAVKWAAGDEEEFDKWSNAFNSKKGKLLYALTVLFPLFPDDIISIVMGSVKMDFLYFMVVHAICSFIGTYTMIVFMRLPIVDTFFNNSNGGFPIALVVYSCLLVLMFTIWLIWTIRMKNKKS